MIVGITQYTKSYEYDHNISEIQEYKYIRDHYYIKRKLKWPVSITRNDWMDDYGIGSFPTYILILHDAHTSQLLYLLSALLCS